MCSGKFPICISIFTETLFFSELNRYWMEMGWAEKLSFPNAVSNSLHNFPFFRFSKCERVFVWICHGIVLEASAKCISMADLTNKIFKFLFTLNTKLSLITLINHGLMENCGRSGENPCENQPRFTNTHTHSYLHAMLKRSVNPPRSIEFESGSPHTEEPRTAGP